LYDRGACARLRSALLAVWEEAGAPVPYARQPDRPAAGVERCETGFVVHGLLGFAPQLERGLLDPRAVSALSEVLGAGLHLELCAGVVCDHHRPFFRWHTHHGGIDDELYRRRGERPWVPRIERVAMLVYLEPMTERSGQLKIYPRRVSDPVEPPFDVDERHWEGEVALTAPAGTVVFLDQSTWHAALPKTDGRALRTFVGLWFRRADAPPAETCDPSLRQLEAPDPVLASVLPPRDG
ncbi:MAG: hypothetical protein D6729_18975, partial [Deltaproteobacteria bacterium]